MKLSELLSKPIKLKGGGLLNLKGFNKRIIDKEIYSENNNNGNNNIDEFDKLFYVKVPKLSSVYNDYYNHLNNLDTVPQTRLANLVQDSVDIPILDPNDDDFFIILVGTFEASSENSANVSLFSNDLNNLIDFTINIFTDQETGGTGILVDNFSYTSESLQSYILNLESYIVDSISKMDIDAIRKLIAKSQVTEEQEI